MSDNKYANDICEAIEYIVANAVENAPYDKTIQATIINCTDPTIGKYKVKYQDSTFFASSENIDVTYTNGSEVYILVPGNDMSRDKVILGTTKKLGANYVGTPEGEDAFETIGTNCIESKNNFELCSYSSNMIKEIYKKGEDESNEIRLNTKAVEEYIRKSSSVLCGAKFRTALPNEQQFRGNYGIIYELAFLDNATENVVMKNYVLDVNQMRGNPYNMPLETRQYGIFNIDANNFQYVNRIYLFVYDFPNKADNKPADIFIKDLEFCGAIPLTEEELNSYALTFITPQGTYFDDNDSDSDIRTLQAQVRVKGKIIDNSSQQLEYYWFVENIGVTQSSRDYNKYGGQGWQCLNNSSIINSGDENTQPVVQWVPGSYEYKVAKADSDARVTKYKCVAVYNNAVVSKEISITNYSANFEIIIESDSGTQFYFDIGYPTLTCKVNGEEKKNSEFKYIWAEVDNNNNFYSMSETVDYNKDYNDAEASYKDLLAKVEAETAMPAASQPLLDEYLTTMKNYDTITRVEGNKIYKIGINTITNFSTFKCAVYHNGKYIGTSSIVLTNSLEAENGYTLIINNGSQVFKYNEDGVAPTNKSVENPYLIPPLSFTVYDNLGNEITDDVISHAEIKWIVPTKDTLLNIPESYSANKTNVDLINNTEIYSDLLILSYTIANKYIVNKIRNNIQLVVNYKGMNLTATTNFTFAKEGDPGTNGTEFLCKIVPNIAEGVAPIYPMILNGQLNYKSGNNGKWFKVQLWHSGEMILDAVETTTTSENKNAVIVWSILTNKYANNIVDESSIEITDAAKGIFRYKGYSGENSPANIVKCSVTYDEVEYFATMPVITATTNSGYEVELKENTGFRFATYSADGRRPQYDNSNPFELIVNQMINGFKEDISASTNQYKVEYNWNIKGKIYNPVNKKWIDQIYLGLVKISDEMTGNPKNIKPLDNYNGECVTNALECVITQNGKEIGRIHIPIHLLLNKYGHAAINGWDGNHVSIDEKGSGVILAPQVGAGVKDENNAFTGVLMGSVKEANQSTADVGLIGYYKGQRTIHIDSNGGYAIFGKQGPGQIILDPTSDDGHGLIYSNNFWAKYYDDNTEAHKNGLPITNYSYNETTYKYNGQKNQNTSNTQEDTDSGMLIDLTTPRILWGNGNFRVDPNGFVYAKGGGEIAGWKIDSYKIHSNDGSSRKTLGKTGMSSVYELTGEGVTKKEFKLVDSSTTSGYNTTEKAAAFWAGTNKFIVAHDGYMKCESATIGSGNNPIFIDKSENNSAIWSGKKSSIDSNNNGFYIGTDGIALGTLNDQGESKFKVTNGGVLTAKSGTIGGWSINRTTLTSGNITLNSNGDIYCDVNGTRKWGIYNNGSATFGNLSINSNGDITANGGTFNDITANRGTFNDISVNRGTFDSITVTGDANLPAKSITGLIQHNQIGSVNAGTVTTGTMSANRISGGTLDIKTANGYVTAGTSTQHLNTSGINVGDAGVTFVGSGGIDLQDKGLGGCNKISNNGRGVEISENVTISGSKRLTSHEIYAGSVLRVQGNLYVGDGDSHGLDWEVQVAKGDTMANQGWHKLIFKKGILCGHSSS